MTAQSELCSSQNHDQEIKIFYNSEFFKDFFENIADIICLKKQFTATDSGLPY
jgi:hypothetical protein